MYPTYCIAPTGQTNYITKPISLDDADCECYLWHWKYFEQSAQSIRVFLSRIIYQYLPTGDGIAIPIHSIDDHHNASIFLKIYYLSRYGCLWWIPYILIWWYMLSRGGRSFCEIIRDPNPHEYARPKHSHYWSRNVWIKIYISTRNGSYVQRYSIVLHGRYCNFHLTLSDTILIFCELSLVHTHFYSLGSQWYTFYR